MAEVAERLRAGQPGRVPPGAVVEIHLSPDPAPPAAVEAFHDCPHAGDEPAVDRRWTPVALVRYADGCSHWFLFDLPDGSDLAVDDGVVSPRYGTNVPAPVLVARAPGEVRVDLRALLWTSEGVPR